MKLLPNLYYKLLALTSQTPSQLLAGATNCKQYRLSFLQFKLSIVDHEY